MRLRSLSLFVVLHTVSNGSRYGNIEAIAYLDFLSTIPTALVRSMNNYLTDKLVQNHRALHFMSVRCSDFIEVIYGTYHFTTVSEAVMF